MYTATKCRMILHSHQINRTEVSMIPTLKQFYDNLSLLQPTRSVISVNHATYSRNNSVLYSAICHQHNIVQTTAR